MPTVQAERLQMLVQRIERLEEEKAGLAGDIKEVYSEAKAAGYDTRVMRETIRRRRMDAADRQEHDSLLEIYEQALGQLRGTPLGQAAMAAQA